MENQNPSVFNTALKYGLIGGLMLIVFSTLLTMTTEPGSTLGGTLSFLVTALVTITISVMVIKNFRDEQLGGYISFGKAFTVSILTLVIIGVITSLYTTIYFNVIDPTYYDEMFYDMRLQYEEAGMDEEAIDMAMRFVEIFRSPAISILIGIFTYAFLGAILSLITGLILKRESPEV